LYIDRNIISNEKAESLFVDEREKILEAITGKRDGSF